MQPEFATLVLEGPVLLFGGPYGNLQASEAVLREAARRGIPASNIICTGDLVAYCGRPRETVALVRNAGIRVVMGNCDEQLGLGASDCACGYAPGSTCDLLSAQWYAYAHSQLHDDDRAYLRGLPERIDVVIGGLRFAVIHGSVSTMNAYVFGSTSDDVLRRELALVEADGVIGGHSGLPFGRLADGKLWLNAGVVGMPANDGTPRVWFSVLTPSGRGVHIEFCALGYDFAAAQADMVTAGLPAGYREALATGIWPSNDVLPEIERALQGMALAPEPIVFGAPLRLHAKRTA
jgi:predicted phosphodiesterase